MAGEMKNQIWNYKLNECEEKLSADLDVVNVFETKFEDFTKGYTRDQIFNTDETRFTFEMLLEISLASKEEKSTPSV